MLSGALRFRDSKEGTRLPYGDGRKNGQKFPNGFASSFLSVFHCSASSEQNVINDLFIPELPKCVSFSSWQASRQDLATACSATAHSYRRLPERAGLKESTQQTLRSY